MGLKITTERELLTPVEVDVLAKLGACGSPKTSSSQRGRSHQTIKNQFKGIYNKIEDMTGRRPYVGNITLFAIFGRFLLLSDRVYRCECGLIESRDLNAALNLRTLGLRETHACGQESSGSPFGVSETSLVEAGTKSCLPIRVHILESRMDVKEEA